MLMVNDLGDRLKAFTNSMTGNCGTVQVLNCSLVVLRVLYGTALHCTAPLDRWCSVGFHQISNIRAYI